MWADDVLAGINAPVTDSNRRILTLWAASEGTDPKWHNWLATTLDGHGGEVVNSAGVKAYPTVKDGVAATVATLRLNFYDAAVKAFQVEAGPQAVFMAVNQSPWCAGCQNGHYPIRLWEYVMSTIADPSHVPGPPDQALNVTAAVGRKDGGVYVLGADGGVFTFHGAPFFGSFPGMPDSVVGDRKARGRFVDIVLDPDEAGYTLIDEHGEGYHLTAAVWADYQAHRQP